MKAVVTNKFPVNVPLVEDWKPHKEGDIVELSEKRFKELLSKGYIKDYSEKHTDVEVAKVEVAKETAKKNTRKKTK